MSNCDESWWRKIKRLAKMRGINPVYAASVIVLFLGLVLTTYNLHKLGTLQQGLVELSHPGGKSKFSSESCSSLSPKYAVYGKNQESGHLKHVYAVLERAGYSRVSYEMTSDWNLLWAHDYPFKKIKPIIKAMKPGQKVNKLPGSGFVTNKVNLATSGLGHIPPAFKIPNDTAKLMDYAKAYPEKMFVQKNSNHRGIKIEKIEKLDLKTSGSFVQEFVHDPFLIDGYKFDIGVYTMITSIDPLRIYVYNGDCLLRFCPKKYHPFDETDRDKYVVHDDYRPTWEVPVMSKIYSDLKYTFKETLNTHIRSVMGDKAPDKLWSTINDIIIDVYTHKEADFISAISRYPQKRGFFEMVRFDFVLDSKLNVYLMEVNMSPNLSTKHFAGNRLLYEQAIYNVLRLVGAARPGLANSDSLLPPSKEEGEMQVSEKDISVFAEECSSQTCSQPESCDRHECRLCHYCLSSDEVEYLKAAYLEHMNRHATKRVYPRPLLSRDEGQKMRKETWNELSDSNAKMHQWFVGKCIMDALWCH